MSEWSPPSLPPVLRAAGSILIVAILAYAILFTGQLLLALLFVIPLGMLYLLWRALAAFEAIADAHQRIAREMESE